MRVLLCAGALTLVVIPALAESNPFTVRVIEGGDSPATAGTVSRNRLSVRVETQSGQPIRGATVTFRLPSEGPGGRFASGMLNESLITNGEGTASVFGIRWADQPGLATVRVAAILDGGRAECVIPVTVLRPSDSGSRSSEASARSGSAARKWLILAGVAGGALAGLAFAGGSSSAAAASSVAGAVSTPITIQPPTISIGKP